MKKLFTNARILKMDGTPIFDGYVEITDNKISYVGKEFSFNKADYERVIDCEGNLLMPGFKDAHTHSAMTFLRSAADDLPLDKWLREVCFPAEDKLKPEDIYYLTKLAILEYLSSGITAVFDMYFYPREIIKAFNDYGMRALVQIFKTSYYTMDEVKNIYRECNDLEESLVRCVFGVHAEYTSSLDDLALAKGLIEEFKSPFFSHISETKLEVKACYEKYGVSPTKLFFDHGLFKYGGGGYHCIYMSDEDLQIFKDHNLSIVINPGSNAKLASGVCDVKKIKEYGIELAIGTDGAASNNCLDMFKEMMLVTNLSKLKEMSAESIPADDVLHMATVGGSKVMMLDKAMYLEKGQFADIIMIDLKRPNMQPINNIVKNLVYSGSKDNVKMTMINGRILYYDRKFYVNDDIDELYKKCQDITDRLLK